MSYLFFNRDGVAVKGATVAGVLELVAERAILVVAEGVAVVFDVLPTLIFWPDWNFHGGS